MNMKHFSRYAIVFALAVMLAPEYESRACTTAIVSAEASSTGRPLLWKQRDTGDPFNIMVYVVSTDTTFAYTGLFNLSDTMLRRAYAGQNEHGFAIVNNNSYNLASKPYSPENGVLLRRALETCATVEDFEAMLRKDGHSRVESNIGVIDACGGAAYFEVCDSSIVRYDVPEGGWLVRSNFSLSGTPDEENFSEAGTSRYARTGFARYVTAGKVMASHKGLFSPTFLIDRLGRCFYNSMLGYDASGIFARRIAYDEDFIARPTTTSSVCFEGGQIMHAAVGYTPASYAMPMKVCEELPGCLERANSLAERVKRYLHPYSRDAGVKYIDFRRARRIMRAVRRYESKAARLVGDNEALDELYDGFERKICKICKF